MVLSRAVSSSAATPSNDDGACRYSGVSSAWSSSSRIWLQVSRVDSVSFGRSLGGRFGLLSTDIVLHPASPEVSDLTIIGRRHHTRASRAPVAMTLSRERAVGEHGASCFQEAVSGVSCRPARLAGPACAWALHWPLRSYQATP